MNDVEIGDRMQSGMAYVGQVTAVFRIDGADRIEGIEVVCGAGGKWRAIAQRGEFNTDDKCEVYLQDAIVSPDDKRVAFMEKYGFRVRMIRLRGAPSEALVLPFGSDIAPDTKVGTDITVFRGVKKYEKRIPASLSGIAKGTFPSFIPRTDEPNFQKVPLLVSAVQEGWFFVTEKCDGTSFTAYNYNGVFGACSRNLEYTHTKENVYWRMAEKYDLENVLAENPGIAVQAEIVGPGIQKNTMGLAETEIRVFDIYEIEGGYYWDGAEVYEFCAEYGLPMVRVLKTLEGANFTDDDWRTLAEGTYENGSQREGIVVRPIIENHVGGQRVSFKVINLLYKED